MTVKKTKASAQQGRYLHNKDEYLPYKDENSAFSRIQAIYLRYTKCFNFIPAYAVNSSFPILGGGVQEFSYVEGNVGYCLLIYGFYLMDLREYVPY
jgi:hypothetical protein